MISVGELRRELHLPPEEDDRLEALRQEVIDLWETETGRPWNERTGFVEILEPASRTTQDLFLDVEPVATVTEVKERSLTESAWTIVPATEYELIAPRRLHRFSGYWTGMVRVTYTGGTTDAPADVKRALLLQARFLIDRMSDAKLITQSQNFEGGAGVFVPANLHPFFKSLAEAKRRSA